MTKSTGILEINHSTTKTVSLVHQRMQSAEDPFKDLEKKENVTES